MSVAELKPRSNAAAPPADLAEKGFALWCRLVDEYALADGPAIVLLEQLCRNLQLARECREVVEAEGKLIVSKGVGTREHPLLRTWRDADKLAHRALRSLNFDLEPLKAIGRPPGGRRAYEERTRSARLPAGRITPAAVEAFEAGDAVALARELGIKPWEVSPIDAEGPVPPAWEDADSWAVAFKLRMALEEVRNAD